MDTPVIAYRVTALRDARAALAALQASPQDFELLVSDYNMPGIDGLQLARAASAAKPRPGYFIS